MTISLHDGASYTMTLRQVCASYDIGLMDYPIFDEGYRLGLNQKIKDHFWLREIGQETPDLFIFMLNRRMREIMPYFNELYRSTRFRYDPMTNVDMSSLSTGTMSSNGTNSATSSDQNTASNKSRSVNSDFPQTMLETEQDYATGANDTTAQADGASTSTSSDTSNNQGTNESQNATTGRQGSGAQLIMEFRAAILNIDMDVIAGLDDLFMLLWHNGDTRTEVTPFGMWPGYAINFGYLF